MGHNYHRLNDIDNKENVVKMEEGDDIDFVDNNINHHYNKLHQHQKPFDHHHYQQQQQLRQLGRLESKVYNQPSRPLRHLDTNNINFNRLVSFKFDKFTPLEFILCLSRYIFNLFKFFKFLFKFDK